jgi:hypothetical protein
LVDWVKEGYTQCLRPREPQKACVTLRHTIDIFPLGW